jgi:polar amino acid transport system substrate-binding protein
MRKSLLSVTAAAAVVALLGGACADEKTTSTSTAAACDMAKPPVKTAGTLTIGTDKPAYSPWFSDDDPANGKGYESAVAYGIATELGFKKDQVKWVTVPFDTSYSPGDKPFDFDINQISITSERKSAVDFSDSYLEINQALVSTTGSKIANATSIAELKEAKIGVQVGTTSLDAVTKVIKPTTEPAVFNNTADATSALSSGQIDGLVVDLPTGFYIVAAELDNGVIVGQFPNASGAATDSFGVVLQKGSKLTGCVNTAIASLKKQKKLEEYNKTYLAEAGAPELK